MTDAEFGKYCLDKQGEIFGHGEYSWCQHNLMYPQEVLFLKIGVPILLGIFFWLICRDAEEFMCPNEFRGLENIHKENMRKKKSRG